MVWRLIRWVVLGAVALVAAFFVLCVVSLTALKWIDPPVTTVQVQRRVEALAAHTRYTKRYSFVPLARISPALQHAVTAAEDARFYQHHGIDWKEFQKVIDTDLEEGQLGRGASTITQQLLKNLFLTTHRSIVRKGVEFGLAPIAERILGKQRILELYLNVIEWGPGIYGAEAASRAWYGVPASQVTREQAARMAAIIPSPRRRKPARMDQYSAEILHRMAQMGW
jgi:monofunctional biosynthetic peptidoglycan transglycosylase